MEPYQHTVQYYETDKMGIVHHSNYIRWMEEARVAYLAQLGWNIEMLEAMGAISPVTGLEAHYKQNRIGEMPVIWWQSTIMKPVL